MCALWKETVLPEIESIKGKMTGACTQTELNGDEIEACRRRVSFTAAGHAFNSHACGVFYILQREGRLESENVLVIKALNQCFFIMDVLRKTSDLCSLVRLVRYTANIAEMLF